MKLIRLTLSMLLISMGSSVTLARSSSYDVWEENYNVSGLLGAVKYEDLKFRLSDSTSAEKADLSLLPQFGGAWNTLPLGDRFQCGLETSFLLGFQADKLNYLYIGGGGLRVSVSTRMWMFDLAGGAYANVYLDPDRKVRWYAGGGPLLMYASYRVKRDYDDGSDGITETETHAGLGGYVRTGIEFRIHENVMLGLGARGTWSRINFTDAGGQSEIVGMAGFFTYTAGF